MKMSIGEKKILFVFGCPNREATVNRLYQVADLIPDPAESAGKAGVSGRRVLSD